MPERQISAEENFKLNAMRLGASIAAISLILASVVYGQLAHEYGLLRKGIPDFTRFGAVRIALSFAAALLLFAALRPSAQAASLAPADSASALRGILIPIGFLLATAGAVHFVPTSLNDFVREMQPLGVATEVVLFAAIACFLLGALRARRVGGQRFLGIFPPSVVLGGMAAVVLVVLMEEMSWGQHWLGWATPELFEENIQNETNLHNFYTYQFEAIYYTSAFFCFVVLPWCWPRGSVGFFAQVEPYLPPPAFALMSLPVASLMYEAWNIVPYQVWYFLGLMIGIDIARRFKTAGLRRFAIALAVIYAAAKLVFLFRGSAMVDGYELSEVREFYISFLFLAYGWMLARRFRQHP